MDDEVLQKQSDPISLADVVWKIREAVELIEANSVVVPADQKRKAEMFSSIDDAGLLGDVWRRDRHLRSGTRCPRR